ncbi:MAG: hypothetical protein LWW94_06825 [Candidatus Desulfofervidaceae bacterium]|nr:hypothetical protein [Candidatus Desulfofervidaceae bacterium]
MKSMEAVVVEMKPKEYIKRVEKENPVEEPWEPDDDYKLSCPPWGGQDITIISTSPFLIFLSVLFLKVLISFN